MRPHLGAIERDNSLKGKGDKLRSGVVRSVVARDARGEGKEGNARYQTA